jgi:hypothetical protein
MAVKCIAYGNFLAIFAALYVGLVPPSYAQTNDARSAEIRRKAEETAWRIAQGAADCQSGQKRYCLPSQLWGGLVDSLVDALNACMYPVGLQSIGSRRSPAAVREIVNKVCNKQIAALVFRMAAREGFENDFSGGRFSLGVDVEREEAEKLKHLNLVQTHIINDFIANYQASLRQLAR